MLKPQRILATLTLAVACVAAGPQAKADVVESVNLTFASGATFSGAVDFSNDYSYVTGVNGILTGYQYGSIGYLGSGSDLIDVVWPPIGTNYSGVSGDIFGTWLLDGTSVFDYSNYFGFSYDYTKAPVLVLDSSLPITVTYTGIAVDHEDLLVSGSIAPVETPEPSSLLFLGSGLVGLAGVLRRKHGLSA
jgi:hypothetical protein